MDKVDLPEANEDVVDYTEQVYTEDKEHKIRISNGISIKDLNSEGIVFHPEIDERLNGYDDNQNYFGNSSTLEEISKLLAEQPEDGIDDDSEEITEFDGAKRRMVDVSGDGGVMKKVLVSGHQTFGSVPDSATITIHYSLQLEGQDEPFDSSVLRGRPERYKLGDGQLIHGLEIGVMTMKKGEKAQFLIDWMYAYGQFGCPPRIPARAVFLATVELLDFVEEGQAEALLAVDPEERNKKHSYYDIEKVVRLEHINGNNYVRKEEWKMALKHYDRGIRLLQEVSLANREEEESRQRIMLKLQLNTAHCCLKVNWPKKACIACREALDIEKENTKALFRYGKAQRMLEDYDQAKKYLLRAQRKAPEDMSVANELRSLENQLYKQRESEKALCMNMFKNASDTQNDKVEAEFFNTMLEELKLFKEQSEKEMSLPAHFTNAEMKAVNAAAKTLEMEVKVEEDYKGNKKIRIVKEESSTNNEP